MILLDILHNTLNLYLSFGSFFAIIQQFFAKVLPIQDQSCCKPNHQCRSHALKGFVSLCARGFNQFLSLSLSLFHLSYFFLSRPIGMLDTD